MPGRPPPEHRLTPRGWLWLAAGLTAFLVYWSAAFAALYFGWI